MSLIVKAKRPDETLRTFNNFLTIIVIVVGLYLIVTPILPLVLFRLKSIGGNQTVPYQSALNSGDNNDNKSVPAENRLVIPQMELDGVVHEGRYASTLKKGIWHRPKTSTPDQGGNTVLVAHRFTYRSPSIFYHLDKLRTGDKFSLYWDGKEYIYQVRETRVVEPSAVQIENNTEEPILTLYTCTPIWTAKQRLVVISDLVKDPAS